MKKIVRFVSIIIICIFTISYLKGLNSKELISDKIIRFHVIANSDLSYDQQLKLKVKDAILEYISPKLKYSKDIVESRKILKENNSQILAIAQNVIKESGSNYPVVSTLSKENFPVKTYGSITLPSGSYEAYRIVIGDGKGKNWWCVMFPPLCFIDITKGVTADKETKLQMRRVLSEEEYKLIDNNNIQLKFKIIELINELKQGTIK